MENVIVDEHAYKHGLQEEDIRYAWEHFIRLQHRGAPNEGQVLAVGSDRRGRLVQMVAVERSFGTLIFHAMTPPTTKALIELGLKGGKP